MGRSKKYVLKTSPSKIESNILVIWGPMYAGKTTEMSIKVLKLRQKHKRVMLVASNIDDRYKKSGSTSLEMHSNLGLTFAPEDVEIVTSIDEISYERISGYDVVCIDEGQFIEGDLVQWVITAAVMFDKRVIIGGLNMWHDKKPIESLAHLVSIGAQSKFLFSQCQVCGEHDIATFSPRIRRTNMHSDTKKRLIENRARLRSSGADGVPEDVENTLSKAYFDSHIKIGGKDLYAAACYGCYTKVADVPPMNCE